ncbi:hypothetical protein J6590_033776, partial [Homalodisca vitripennis]
MIIIFFFLLLFFRPMDPVPKHVVSSAVNDDQVKPRSLRFTWSMKTTSSRDPNEIMAEIRKPSDVPKPYSLYYPCQCPCIAARVLRLRTDISHLAVYEEKVALFVYL